ncbi:MAG: hypothetical protein JWL70_998 [Acidimicrobiia bacterium]|nr:hypothetical protein [Acidimicrobiia bacterium]
MRRASLVLVVAVAVVAGGAGTAWASGNNDYVSGMACPSAALCLAISDQGGNTFVTRNPGADPAPWTMSAAPLGVRSNWLALGCTPQRFCVAASESAALITRDAGAVPLVWESAGATGLAGSTGPVSFVTDISCRPEVCAAITGDTGRIAVLDPAAPELAWRATQIGNERPTGDAANPTALTGVSCPSAALCVVVDRAGRMTASTNPMAQTPTWSTPTPIDDKALTAVECPSVSLCVAADAAGRVLTTRDPAGPPSGWSTPMPISNQPLTGLSCPSESFCAAAGGDVFITTQPGSGAAWTELDPAMLAGTSPFVVSSISCAGPALCIVPGVSTMTSLTSTAPRLTRPVPLLPSYWGAGVNGRPTVRGHTITTHLYCEALVACRMDAVLKARKQTIGSAHFVIPAQTTTATRSLRLSRHGERLLARQARLRATLTTTWRNAPGYSAARTFQLTIRRTAHTPSR